MSLPEPPHCPDCGHLAVQRDESFPLAYVVQHRQRTSTGARQFYCTHCYTKFTADDVGDKGWVAAAPATVFAESQTEPTAQATQTEFAPECDCRRCQHDTYQYSPKIELSG